MVIELVEVINKQRVTELSLFNHLRGYQPTALSQLLI